MKKLILIPLLCLVGCVTDEQGNKHLSTEATNAMWLTAQTIAKNLASDYLKTGNIDYKHDLISGALSQVYTLEGTTTPLTATVIEQAVGNVVTNPGMKTAITDAVLNVVNSAPKGTSKDVAITEAIGLLDYHVGTQIK